MQYFAIKLDHDLNHHITEKVGAIEVVHAYNTNQTTGNTMVRGKSKRAAIAFCKAKGLVGKAKKTDHE